MVLRTSRDCCPQSPQQGALTLAIPERGTDHGGHHYQRRCQYQAENGLDGLGHLLNNLLDTGNDVIHLQYRHRRELAEALSAVLRSSGR